MALYPSSRGLSQMRVILLCLSALAAISCLIPTGAAAPYYQDNNRPGLINAASADLNQISSLDFLRYLLLETRARMMNNYPRTIGTDQTSVDLRKRGGSSSCLFNAGLAHNCDYRDVIGAVNEVNHWGSDLAPGRRKREARFVDQRKQASVDLFGDMIRRAMLEGQ